MFIFDLDQVQDHRAQLIVMAFRLSHVLGCLPERPSIYVQRATANPSAISD
jgi:hypothetical protein